MTDRVKYKNPFAMGNLDDLFNARIEDDVEYLKEWSKKAVKKHESTRNIQMNIFKRLIHLNYDSSNFVKEIQDLLREEYEKE